MQAVRGVRVAVLERVDDDDRQAVFVRERDRRIDGRVLVGAQGLHEPAEHVVAPAHLHAVRRQAPRAQAEGVETGERVGGVGRIGHEAGGGS